MVIGVRPPPRTLLSSRRRLGSIFQPVDFRRPRTEAETKSDGLRAASRWIPAFPTDQVRRLKAHGMTWGLAAQFAAWAATTGSRTLRGDAQVFVLMENAVERVLLVLFDLKDADFPVGDVAVLVKADLALQRLGFRGLDRVADIGAVDLLARFGNALDRI